MHRTRSERLARPLKIRQAVTAGLLIAIVLGAASYAQHGSPAPAATLLTVAVLATGVAAAAVVFNGRRHR